MGALRRILLVLGALFVVVTAAPTGLFVTPAFAVNPDEVLADPALEARARKLSEGLRCLVCQNQNLAESHAGLAMDLKRQVAEMVSEGKSNDEIKTYLQARYGDFVLYRPPFKPLTWVLWIAPFALLLMVLLIFFRQAFNPFPAGIVRHIGIFHADRILIAALNQLPHLGGVRQI